MKKLLVLCLLLSGCASSNFENRIVVTLAGDRAFVNSLYGKFGITTEIDIKDVQSFLAKPAAKP